MTVFVIIAALKEFMFFHCAEVALGKKITIILFMKDFFIIIAFVFFTLTIFMLILNQFMKC